MSTTHGVPTRSKQEPLVELFLSASLNVIFFAYYLVYTGRYYYNQLNYRLASSGAHHHRSPQLIRSDVVKLDKVPQHIAAILNLEPVSSHQGGVQGLLNSTGELAGWCIGAGARELTVYERSGALQQLPLKDIVNQVQENLEGYFGHDGVPSFQVRRSNGEPVPYTAVNAPDCNFTINLLSEKDGRPVIVQLARQLARFASENKIKSEDITVDFVDNELQQLVGHEPDLVIMFTPRVDLQGFPPWHIRVSEIFYLPDNNQMSYLVFKRALEKFSGSKINLGK